MRLDAFLARHFSDISRARWKKRIASGFVRVDGEPGRAAQKLPYGAQVVVAEVTEGVQTASAEDLPLDIVYEDDDVIVVNKAPGMVVHPSAGHQSGTLVNALLHHVPGMFVADETRPGIVHRLDKDTSGLIVCAKSDLGFSVLGEQFRDRTVDKVYVAFCYGRILESPLHLVTGHMRSKTNRMRFTTRVAAPEQTRDGNIRRAEADYIAERYGGGVSRVQVVLKTGRTHQIRAQLTDVGHALVGDELYGGTFTAGRIAEGPVALACRALKRQALHAHTLSFTLPSGERVSLTAELPEDLARLDAAVAEAEGA